MQFTTFALSALSIGSALAQNGVTVHVVRVGSMNGSLAYYPNNIKAEIGDMVQFQFAPKNHTVTQSSFDTPCQPIASNSNVTGIYSGFMPVTASSTTTPTYTIMVSSKTPMWLYCSQGRHCQNGMTMVINENPRANNSRTLSGYQALAAQATVNLPGASVSGGSSNSTTGGSRSGSGSGSGAGGSGSGSGSGSSPSSPSGTSPSGSAPQATISGSAAYQVRASDAFGLSGLLAMGLSLLL